MNFQGPKSLLNGGLDGLALSHIRFSCRTHTLYFKYMLYIIYIYIYVNQYRTKSGQFEAGDQQTAQRTRLKVAEEKQRQEKEVTGRDDGLTGWNKCLGVRSLPLLKSFVDALVRASSPFFRKI